MDQALIKAIKNEVSLTKEEADQILTHFSRKNFKRGEIVLQSGAVAREAYFIETGVLQIYYTDETGNEHTSNFGFTNNFVSDLESFTRKIPSASSIRALKPTSCLAISCQALTQLVEQSEPVREFFNGVVEHMAAESMKRTKSLLMLSPEERFLELMALQPDIFQLVPQRYIAGYLGVAAESLSRIKRRLMSTAKS